MVSFFSLSQLILRLKYLVDDNKYTKNDIMRLIPSMSIKIAIDKLAVDVVAFDLSLKYTLSKIK